MSKNVKYFIEYNLIYSPTIASNVANATCEIKAGIHDTILPLEIKSDSNQIRFIPGNNCLAEYK